MTGRLESGQNGNRQSQIDNAVWSRLQQRMDDIRSAKGAGVDPDALAKKLAERAKVLRGRAERAEPKGEHLAFLAFNNAGRRYGIPICHITEVQPLEQYTPVPGAPDFVPGVIHWRGAIMSLVDLGRLYGLPESGLADLKAFIVVQAAGRRIGLLAGEVEEICSVAVKEIKTPPELPADVPAEWLVGVQDENRMILAVGQILQHERLLDWRRA